MVRTDTYIVDRPENPPYRAYADAKKRKEEILKDEKGWRVKIRKDADGNYVVYKKHDELFHDKHWRDEPRQT